MHKDQSIHQTIQATSSTPLPQQHQEQYSPQEQQPSPSLVNSDLTSQQPSPRSPHQSSPLLSEFSQGEDAHAPSSKTATASLRIGSTGSQIISPVNEVRKRTGRRVLHRPRPLDLDYSKLNWRSSQQQQHQQQVAVATGPEPRTTPTFPAGASGTDSEPGQNASPPKDAKHRSKFPLLHIKTDLNPATSFRRTSTTPVTNNGQNNTSPAVNGASNIEIQRKEPSKWQAGLERMLKKIQRRKRAPSNLVWYAAHSTESYLSGATLDARAGALKQQVDTELEGLYFGHDKPPRWVVNSLQEADLFYSDDTVDLMRGLRDYLIKATENGWDVAELKEEIFPINYKSVFRSRRNRSVSPHGSPGRVSPNTHTSAPASPGAVSQESPHSSRRGSRSSFEFDRVSQHVPDRYADEEAGSYRLLDYFIAILSDVISHDCRYQVQHPRPSRPEWFLHSIVLDVLLYLSKVLAHDHKAIYDIGMIALSAFPIFKNNALIRLLDLLTDIILPSFALSRTQPFSSTLASPPLAPLNPSSPLSPSEIRVQLENNQTFAIQVHSPTEEQEMPPVPREGGQSLNTLNSPHIPSSRSSSTSLSRVAPGSAAQAQDTMDTHASSLISLTLLAVLQQISFSKSPLPVAKQLQKSIGDLLRIKPDLSVDLLEVIAIVENEKVMHRALEVLWWIGKPSLGHHTLSDKFFPLDYDSILQMRQTVHEWSTPTVMSNGLRTNTVKSDTLFSFRRGSLDEYATPKTDSSTRNNSAGSFGIRSRLGYRPSLPWRSVHGSETTPLSNAQHQVTAVPVAGTDYLADHELYPYMFAAQEADDIDTDSTRTIHCERCEVAMEGFGLYCYHCRGALHLGCFYSVKRYAGMDCAQQGCALEYVCQRPRNELVYPVESDVYESSSNQIYRMRAGHHLQLVNLFSTCLCTACKLPLWGYHCQAYRCGDCAQLMHLDCKGSLLDCRTATQPLALPHSFPISISYDSLRQSFLEFYQELVSSLGPSQATAPVSGAASISSPVPSSHMSLTDRFSYEEASCNATALTLQLELLKTAIERGELQVLEWMQDGQSTDQDLMAESGFELLALQKCFEDLAQCLRENPALSGASSLFLSDFFEESRPDTYLLFSAAYWSHFASLTKTIIKDAETAQANFNHIFSPPFDGGPHGEDMFMLGGDHEQEKLLVGHSVQSSHVPLATIFRFCMRRLGFQNPWTMRMILQEWVKIGLLERLDGELCLFENVVQDRASVSPDVASVHSPSSNSHPKLDGRSGSRSSTLPTFQTSYFDDFGNSSRKRPGVRNVHCLFPVVTAIDPTPNVENMIHAIWRCLTSVDLSVNECGFLLLTRQCWPDPFMSDYTVERLLGCVFHWLLLEDNHLFVIHKNYASKSKKIPGVRNDLEEQMARKRAAINCASLTASVSSGSEDTTSTSTTSGHTTSSVTAITTAPNTNWNANQRTSSANSNLFGAVGSYVLTRKLMVKTFALPWLKQVLALDPKRYVEMAYRQIRVLEREMAPEDEQESLGHEEQQKFRQSQAERYLESITKVRQAGFLFNTFPTILCRWLKDVEEMLDGMDISSKGFKTLNRLFMKASGRNGSGLGLGTTHHGLGKPPTPTSVNRETVGAVGGDNEWRSRLKAKLYRGSGSDGVGSQSPNGQDTPVMSGPDTVAQPSDEARDSPLNSLRLMLKPSQAQDTRSDGNRVKKALFWLDLMVQSGVQVPTQAFLECCEGLVDMANTPELAPVDGGMAKQATAPAPSTNGTSPVVPDQVPHPAMSNSELLEMSKDFLKTCWDHIVISAHRMSETEAGEIVEIVLATNQAKLLEVMNEGAQTSFTKDLESVQQLLKHALVIVMYIYGCPLQETLALKIVPASADVKIQSQQPQKNLAGSGRHLPLQQQHHRQHHHSLQQLQLDRDSLPISMFLKCLRLPSLALQGEIIKGLAVMLEHSGRVSNVDEFMDSIQAEIVPCLWELLSPLNDHMAEITLPLLMRFISHHPGFFHKTVAQCFNDQDWETRFSALDSVFGLFSKLDDALVLKLFFQQTVSTASLVSTMTSNKGKGTERGQRQSDRQQQQQRRTGTNSSEPANSESSGTGLSGQGRKSSAGSRADFSFQSRQHHQHQPRQQSQQYQQVMSYAQFVPEDFQILGPIFSFFVSSMWDKEEAVRTKAKTLLKSLQPVHVGHALKAWELHFIASAPDAQQTLLKLMTRLNNYFPSWKIMDYKLVFKLLTSGGLGQPESKTASASLLSRPEANEVAPVIRGSEESLRPDPAMASTTNDEIRTTDLGDFMGLRSRRASLGSLSLMGTGSGILPYEGFIGAVGEPSNRVHGRRASVGSSSLLNASPMMPFMPTGEPSRSQKRASVVSTIMSAHTSTASLPAISADADADAREQQLALEDDIHCSLLNLALQMVANGIEPRLDEVIQLKYLVVFYLDFEGCELLSLGQGKFQVRYGEYIPRQRVSPVQGHEAEAANGANGLLNDPGHENFVLAICRNLQLILDRYVEIKPDYERDPPTLYDRLRSRDANYPGAVAYGYEGTTTESDVHAQSPSAGRTFSATTATTADFGKESTRVTASSPRDDDDDDDNYDQEHHHRHHGLFCFPRRKHHQNEHHHSHRHTGDSFNQRSAASEKNQFRQSYYASSIQHTSPHYQQHHHHHYRRNQNRRLDEDTPVVGTYFVDVILRFFGSETDLSILPAGRLKDWLELLHIVIYKYVKEVDPLSDLVVILMKRIIEMLMVKKGTSSSSATAAASTVGAMANHMASSADGATVGAGNAAPGTSAAGEKSISEENTLLAISICSTLLKRSSTMTTALLSREIMAMGRLMTRRRDDDDDPVLIRAKNFLHDAFVHFMGNGLFVLVFKTQPAYSTNSFDWEDEGREVDQDLDLFYVLGTVLGETEMVLPDPANSSSAAHSRPVHFRDQPIRDILDRVMIFRDLEPAQVSTILTNLALYVERVHCKFEDPHLLQDMGIFLIKVTKYTAEWDHQQQQKQKEQLQQWRQAQEQQQYQLLMQQQQQMKQQAKPRASHYLFSGNTSTMVSNGSSVQKHQSPQHQHQHQHGRQRQEQKQPLQQQKQGVMSITSGSTVVGATEQSPAILTSSQPVAATVAGVGSRAAQGPPVEQQRKNTATSITLTPTTATTLSSSSLSETPAPTTQQQGQQHTHQSTMPSSVASESPSPPTAKPSFARRKSAMLKNMASFDLESNPFAKSRNRQNSAYDSTLSSSHSQDGRGHHHGRSRHQQFAKPAAHKLAYVHHWDYSNPVLSMCAILMIQNPLEGHHLITAVKHVLRQALYRDKISAPTLIRLVTGYCYMAELDFSLSLVNVFGEFVVEELKTSIQNRAHSKYEDEVTPREDEAGDESQDQYHHRHGHHLFRKSGKAAEKEKDNSLGTSGVANGGIGVGGVNLGLGSVGLGGGVGGGNYAGGRTKILASNLHLLHHLLIWDLDPSYNMEWTHIKWGILGSMRFPPGHPILFPGANDTLRQETAIIIGDWVDRHSS